MSTNATGLVQSLGSRVAKTKFGNKDVHSFKVDNEWYSMGFKKPTFVAGDTVTFEWESDTYGKKLVDNTIKVLGSAAAGAVPSAHSVKTTSYHTAGHIAGNKGVFPIPALDGQRAIVRQNSITNAVKLVTGGRNIDDETIADYKAVAKQVIDIAKIFEAYSCGDDDMEAAKAAYAEATGA